MITSDYLIHNTFWKESAHSNKLWNILSYHSRLTDDINNKAQGQYGTYRAVETRCGERRVR